MSMRTEVELLGDQQIARLIRQTTDAKLASALEAEQRRRRAAETSSRTVSPVILLLCLPALAVSIMQMAGEVSTGALSEGQLPGWSMIRALHN